MAAWKSSREQLATWPKTVEVEGSKDVYISPRIGYHLA
jgi:hypothetical protein